MAASLSRPDPSSPASVAEAGFSTARRGYNQDEVRALLTSVAAELGRLQERERQLEAQLRTAEQEVAPAPELDEETVAAILGEETLRVLQTARESASQIKIRAEEAAAKVLGDANDEINRLRQEAEVESARKRHDASSDAEAEVALAKQQGREMVNEARAYRERVLADLERRTKLARQQIEDLVHGRDRLLQVFERARLVAVDVTSELQSIDGPEELVNFSPTTGPLPLMVPAGEIDRIPSRQTNETDRPAEGSDGPDEDEISDLADASDESERPDEVDERSAETSSSHDDAVVTDASVDVAADDSAEVDTDDRSDAIDEPVVREPADEPSSPPDRDANVVSLFRDRPGATDEDEIDEPDVTGDGEMSDDGEMTDDDAVEDPASARDDRPDVNGIFERLRSETPDAADVEDTAGAPALDAAEVDAVAESDPDDPDAEPVSTPFSRRDEALVPLIVSGARKLKRVLADEQNGVLDLLRRNEPVTQLDEIADDAADHVSTYVEALADDLLEAAVAGAVEVGKNDTKTLRTTLRRGALDRSHAVVGDDLVVPLRQRLERAISDGAGDNEDITKRVRAVYREWKTQHIDDQLDDAFRFAHGGGLAVGVKPGTPLTWTIDPAEPTCPDCEDNSLAGVVSAGEEFPTGHMSAPAHPGCRCLTVPVGQ